MSPFLTERAAGKLRDLRAKLVGRTDPFVHPTTDAYGEPVNVPDVIVIIGLIDILLGTETDR